MSEASRCTDCRAAGVGSGPSALPHRWDLRVGQFAMLYPVSYDARTNHAFSETPP
jgi:hypothetical protein